MSLPRMSWHIGDYKKDTGNLDAAGHGAYFLLTMHYWATGGLPDDDDQLSRIACMSKREWKKLRPLIQALFKGEGVWRHKRIDEEIALAQAKYEKRVKAGRKGNDVRWGAKVDPPAPEDGSQCDRNAIPTPSQPITDNRERVTAAADARATPLVSPQAFEVAKQVGELCGYPDPQAWPPGWCGSPMTVQKWLTEGWPVEIITATCRGSIGKKRGSPPNTITYFEKAIAEAVAQHAAPLPKVKIIEGNEVIHAQANQPAGRSGGGFASFARKRALDAAKLAGGT